MRPITEGEKARALGIARLTLWRYRLPFYHAKARKPPPHIRRALKRLDEQSQAVRNRVKRNRRKKNERTGR